MNEITFEILKCVLIVCTIIITKILVPYVKLKIEDSKDKKFYDWAIDAVNWAEQKFKGTGRGKEKYIEVKNFLLDLAKEKNIEISDKQLDVLIESVVKNL